MQINKHFFLFCSVHGNIYYARYTIELYIMFNFASLNNYTGDNIPQVTFFWEYRHFKPLIIIIIIITICFIFILRRYHSIHQNMNSFLFSVLFYIAKIENLFMILKRFSLIPFTKNDYIYWNIFTHGKRYASRNRIILKYFFLPVFW